MVSMFSVVPFVFLSSVKESTPSKFNPSKTPSVVIILGSLKFLKYKM